MTIWTNADGLRVRFGRTKGETALTGQSVKTDDVSTAIGTIDASRLPAFGDSAALLGNLPVVKIPAGAVIEKVELKVDTAFTSGGLATLDLGLVAEDTTTEIDFDGFVAAEAVADMTEGATLTGAGALVGTKLATGGYLSVDVGTADFTAGAGRVEVTYRRTA